MLRLFLLFFARITQQTLTQTVSAYHLPPRIQKSSTNGTTHKMLIDRAFFFKSICPLFIATASSTLSTSPVNAIEFVPSSPSFRGTYQDAIEILYSQRIALDNISDIIYDGNLEEAGFKLMQLSAQTRTAGKIILDSFQERTSSIDLLRFLSCQKKFATFIDLSDECGISVKNALRGQLGATAAAQLKILPILNETKNAYDDFLREIQ